MWHTIVNNINTLILANWKALFMFVLGALAGVFLLSCAMTNKIVDGTQEVLTDGVEWIMDGDAAEVEATDAE
tara:strand:- start:36 stop:251 length:216 start_codon:yes stop_codon:yes gene_type:complete